MDDVSVAPKLLSFQVLEAITNGFSKDRKVGAGSYGNVYKGEHTNGAMIAVKVLHYIPGLDDEQFEKEYHNLANLQHKNIVQLIGYCHETRRECLPFNGKMVFAEMPQRALCFEYMQNGSLDRFLTDESTGLDWHTRYAIIKGICQGLKYLHEELDPPMYHLDLKPGNVLLDENMVPKIADFGLSRLFGGEQTQMTKSPIGTPGYIPPEYIEAAIISIKFDIFSLGVVIIKIMTGPKGYFRSAEMSPQQFIQLVHGNWMSKLQTTLVHALEPYSEQVKRCIEIALSCVDPDRYKRPSIGKIIDKLSETETEVQLVGTSVNHIGSSMYKVINFDSKQTKKQYTGSGTPIEPGSVQLVIKNNKKAPLLEYEKKVMLELTSGDHTSNRPGLDLVAVLEVRGSMHGEKMDQMKIAMRFVLRKLSPIDRLSIVTFSYASTMLCPLRQITETSQRELQELIDGLKAFGGGSNINDGVLTGLKVLADRKVKDGRVAAIMLVSNDHNLRYGSGKATEAIVCDVPVYTFGYGDESDNLVLSTVAANSMGGTFSHVTFSYVQEQGSGSGGMTMAFSQCLAGLLSVSVQDLVLSVAPVGDDSRILKVTAGNYPQTQDQDANGASGSVTIRFGNLYGTEVRKVIVNLSLPAIESERSVDILRVMYSFRSSLSGRPQFVSPPEILTTWRTSSVDVEDKLVELQREEVRLQTVNMIREARTMMGYYWAGNEQRAHDKLVEAQNMMDEQSSPLLWTDLQNLVGLSGSRFGNWLPYAVSLESSHERQRFAFRGGAGGMEIMRPFATLPMDMYLEQAKKFLEDQEIPLPSTDDDVTQVNVASRKEEMRRLSLETEI